VTSSDGRRVYLELHGKDVGVDGSAFAHRRHNELLSERFATLMAEVEHMVRSLLFHKRFAPHSSWRVEGAAACSALERARRASASVRGSDGEAWQAQTH
jgi:hypothetical protein